MKLFTLLAALVLANSSFTAFGAGLCSNVKQALSAKKFSGSMMNKEIHFAFSNLYDQKASVTLINPTLPNQPVVMPVAFGSSSDLAGHKTCVMTFQGNGIETSSLSLIPTSPSGLSYQALIGGGPGEFPLDLKPISE